MTVTKSKKNGVDILTIEIPMTEPAASKTGKSLLVASSGGIKPTSVLVDGKVVNIGLNAFIKA